MGSGDGKELGVNSLGVVCLNRDVPALFGPNISIFAVVTLDKVVGSGSAVAIGSESYSGKGESDGGIGELEVCKEAEAFSGENSGFVLKVLSRDVGVPQIFFVLTEG